MRGPIAALILVWAAPMMAAAETVVITADRMIDVAAGSVVEAPVVVITDGHIASVSTRGVIPSGIPADARRIDLPGHTILPVSSTCMSTSIATPVIKPIGACRRYTRTSECDPLRKITPRLCRGGGETLL